MGQTARERNKKKKEKALLQSESTDKELCPRCQSDEFAIDKQTNEKRYCSKCRFVWMPLSLAEIRLAKKTKALEVAEFERDCLKEQVDELIQENATLKEKLELLG